MPVRRRLEAASNVPVHRRLGVASNASSAPEKAESGVDRKGAGRKRSARLQAHRPSGEKSMPYIYVAEVK